jgi:formylglycine-generating enzyme required for sulfatase activity
MGSLEGDEDAFSYEKPQHEVVLSGYYLAKFPVTQALWRAVATAPSEGG